MGYLYLGISLLSGATKGYCGKKMGCYTKNVQSAIILNLIRMAMCVALGFVFLWINHETLIMSEGNLLALGISALSGITTAIVVVIWLLAVRQSAFMMIDVFLMIGTIVPMIFGSILFSEKISFMQWRMERRQHMLYSLRDLCMHRLPWVLMRDLFISVLMRIV